MTEWCTKVDEAETGARHIIEMACSSFQVFPVRNKQENIRLQFAMCAGPIRAAVLSSLETIGIQVSSGPAPRSFLEEELADWIACLSVDD